ncbi:class F sortase [Streptomyces sp. NPDC048192]|jgi:sortase (surface protein transpeptidase)|uniref:class F sortase n=1 Tax=Streptomyces sp. NPDC048192 TaxID=3365510 RepID=UPI003720386A
MTDDRGHTTGTGRLATGLTWAVLLFGLWLWGRGVTGVPHTEDGPATGGLFAAAPRLPGPARPLGDALPQRLDIPQLRVQAPVVSRGLDAQGAIDPPPYDQPGVVGWYGAGTKPGASGAALLVGHVDTETRPAVFYKLSTLKPGDTVRVVRSDGKVARFTVDDVRVLPRAGFDARQAYAPHHPGRAELRLITCGGPFDRAAHRYTANVVVSAYLTGSTG